MNLVMASVLLLAVLAFQPTLIYGVAKKDLASATHSHIRGGSGKRHFSSSLTSSSPAAKLVMAFESGDVLVRSARGAAGEGAAAAMGAGEAAAAPTAMGASNGGAGAGSSNKRQKNNHKKSNKNSTPENASSTNAGRKHLDKKFSATTANQQQQQQQHHGNGKGKQRQLVKSQQHQGHGRRGGGKLKSETSVEKSTDAEKTQSTCRYSKSAWSECDAKTNMRSRTLTLKQGEANCLPTRTMQKKCAKTCRYDKGVWSECTNGQMSRQDKLKTSSSTAAAIPANSSCEPVRTLNKKCNPGGAGKPAGGKGNKERKNRDKASRRGAQQQA